MYDVVTIGSATRDGFFRMSYELIDWPKTPTGKAIVFPLGEKVGVDEVFFTIGGNAVNAAVTFSRQGFRTACAAKIGKDVSGEELRRRLEREGVDTQFLTGSDKLSTAYSVLFLLQSGERTILGYPGASNTLTLKDLDLPKLKARWWYISLAGESAEMFDELARFATKNGIRVAFNPSGHHLKEHRANIIERLKAIDFLVVNEGEAAELAGISFEHEDEVFSTLDQMLTPGIVAVTRGPKGVIVSDGRFRYRAGTFPEKKLVDRTGAGDAFGSGFVAGLMLKDKFPPSPEDIEYAIRLASANATSVVEQIGASEGTLTQEQFEQDPMWRELSIERIPLLG